MRIIGKTIVKFDSHSKKIVAYLTKKLIYNLKIRYYSAIRLDSNQYMHIKCKNHFDTLNITERKVRNYYGI
jgi:hypothetical protein